jgi:hypothetical protein
MQYARATRIGLYKIVYSFIFISDDNSVEEDKLKKSEKVGVHELDRFRSTKSASENQERSQRAKGKI